jgi:hypothetical protein
MWRRSSSVSAWRSFAQVEGITAARIAQLARAHPEADICLVEGTWHAWIPDRAGSGGAEAHGRTEEELLAKLGAVR